MTSKTRVLGIDLGSRRIGVAVSDSAGRVATPIAVIDRRGDRAAEHGEIRGMVEELGVSRVVVGMPLSLDGTAGSAAREALEEACELAGELGVEVTVQDERLTTVAASRSMREAGSGGRAARQRVDSVAAAVMLQSWLDRERS